MIEKVRIAAAAAMLVAWAGIAAAEGLYWESTITGVDKDPRVSQSYAVPKRLKIVGADGQVLILRADLDKFYAIDTKKQKYREISITDMEAAAKSAHAQMEAAHAQMQARLKDMPPQKRAMMEKMMPPIPGTGADKVAPVEVKNTGETKSIGGYTCTKYVATQDGQTVLVAWATTDVKGFESLRPDWLAYQKRMAGMHRGFGGTLPDAYAHIEGFPIETQMGDVKTLVTKIEARRIPAGEFEVPDGYKKEESRVPKAPPNS